MVSIAEYAKQKQISYQAVNQQIKRYQKELKGHISKQGKTRFLDDEAVEFLNQKRKENPVTIVQDGRTERIDELEEQVRMLTAKIVDLQDRLIKSKDTIEQLQADNIKLLTAAAAAGKESKEDPESTTDKPVEAVDSPVTGEVEEIQGEGSGSPQDASEGGAAADPDPDRNPPEAGEQTEVAQVRKESRLVRAWKVLWGKE